MVGLVYKVEAGTYEHFISPFTYMATLDLSVGILEHVYQVHGNEGRK